jgi:hypothetical protein
MNLFDAINSAAAHIERFPTLFRFESVYIPGNCGTPGCALGLIALFLGVSEDQASQESGSTHTVHHIATKYLGTSWPDPFKHDDIGSEFYQRLSDLTDPNWKSSATKCAKALRLYAAKYHAPAIEPLPFVDLPASVRAIFSEGVAA